MLIPALLTTRLTAVRVDDSRFYPRKCRILRVLYWVRLHHDVGLLLSAPLFIATPM
jgi:hypothetical protein